MLVLVLLIMLFPAFTFAQTMNARTLAGDGTPITDTTAGRLDVTVQSPINAAQSGTWNVNNIAGTISLPTGASTEATLGTLLLNSTFTGRLPAAFASADNIAAQTATFMHGGMMAWDSGGGNWDRLLLTSGALHVNVQNASLAVTGTFWQATQPISAASLPLPTGAATAANQDGIIKDGTGDTTQANVVSGRLQVDGSGVTQPVSGTVNIGTFPDNEPINVAQMNGVAVTMGNGASGTGVQRVTIASDSTGTLAVTQATASSLNAQVVGSVAHDGVDAGNPVKIGCHARTTNRTAVADADRADIVCDDNGQLVVTPMAPRDRVVRSGVVTVSTTTETTLLAAGGAGVFRDLTYLKCTNNSATLVRVDLRDATAGTVIDSWALAASGGGFNLAFSVPYAQASANNNWTIQLSGAVTDVRCSCQAVEKN